MTDAGVAALQKLRPKLLNIALKRDGKSGINRFARADRANIARNQPFLWREIDYNSCGIGKSSE